MTELAVGKRRFHAFLSHAHVDRAQADMLFKWLHEVAAVPVWYDAVNMPPGATIVHMLPEAIENSRSLILLLSKESVSRGWVQQEYSAAINHQTHHRSFRIIPVLLDDVSPPGFLQNYSSIALYRNGLDVQCAAAILRGLYQPATSVDPTNGCNTYVSRGWHTDDAGLAEAVCVALESAGLQLIGDSEDQLSWVEARVANIIEGCGAFVAILPYRAHAQYKTSKYILREWELATSLELPCLVFADNRVDLPPEILGRPGRVTTVQYDRADAAALADAAATLSDDWKAPVRAPYAFYASDFGGGNHVVHHAVRDLVEAVTTLRCMMGEYVSGPVVQREILRAVSSAALLIADISGDSPNVYIEIGAARVANVPVYILRKGPPGRPAFMLRDQQVWDYLTEPELLARAVRIAYPFRRTLVSPRTY